jgi:hypothetical protein
MTQYNLWVAQRWERGERVECIELLLLMPGDETGAPPAIALTYTFILRLFSAELPCVVARNPGGPKSDSWTALSTNRNAHCIATNTHM